GRWESVAKRLEELYASALPDSEKLAKREEVFVSGKVVLGVKTLNNAVIAAHRIYRADLGDFRAAFERLGRDWPKMIALLRSLDPRRPKAALKEWLRAPGSPRP